MKKIQKILLFLGITSLGALIGICLLPIFSLLFFMLLNTFMEKKIDPDVAIALPFLWAPILGLIMGAIIALKLFFFSKAEK